MPVFTLALPGSGKVFYVGEAEGLHKAVGNLLLRPPASIEHILLALEAEELMPVVRVHEWETKQEIREKHARTVRNAGRRGPEKTVVLEAGIKYSERLRLRLKRKGATKEALNSLTREISWRGIVWARRHVGDK